MRKAVGEEGRAVRAEGSACSPGGEGKQTESRGRGMGTTSGTYGCYSAILVF